MKSLKVGALSLLAYCSPALSSNPYQRQHGQPMVYGFDTIEATEDINWVPCFDKFTCTKLKVPLDDENEAAGTTHVSFIKWTSPSNSTWGNSAAQDILLNPGGPGGSGINKIEQDLDSVLAAVGTAHNIIGFDPRGVNNSGPDVSCFPGQKGTTRFYRNVHVPIYANDTRSYADTYALTGALGEFCTNVHSNSNATAKYANTVATAHDMLRYTELLAKSKGQDPKKSQLWYFGVSYGTILGTTFASLFPDRVGRIVIDGVVDGEDYYLGRWTTGVVDADKAFQYFFNTCHEAGADNCAFWAESPAAIEARLDAVIEDLTRNPIPISGSFTPAIATAASLKSFMANVPYDPLFWFPLFAQVLAELEQGDVFLLTLFPFSQFGSRSSECQSVFGYQDFEPRHFIACADSNGRHNLSSFGEWTDHANELVGRSKYLGEYWAATSSIYCRSLDIRAPESQVLKDYPSAKRTSNPLLFVSTAIDPVTPLRAAEKMAKRFGGAGLLVQDSVGHVTWSAPSKCTVDYVKRYWESAELPAEGSRCDPDEVPFQNAGPPILGEEARVKMMRKRSVMAW